MQKNSVQQFYPTHENKKFTSLRSLKSFLKSEPIFKQPSM